MTPGMKTSEFYMSLVSIVIGIALLVMGAIRGDQNMISTGAAMIAGSAGAFSVARGIAKTGDAPVPASPSDAAKVASRV